MGCGVVIWNKCGGRPIERGVESVWGECGGCGKLCGYVCVWKEVWGSVGRGMKK